MSHAPPPPPTHPQAEAEAEAEGEGEGEGEGVREGGEESISKGQKKSKGKAVDETGNFVVTVNADNFDELVVSSGKAALVMFMAPW